MSHSEDKIEKLITLKAPVGRVWRALTDYTEFGAWFRVNLDGPFEPGLLVTGKLTFPGYEHHPWRATVERMEPEALFSFRWHDFDEKSDKDIADQPTTLVEFRLESIDEGTTQLTIIESGFSAIDDPRRLEALRDNNEGWDVQAKQLSAYVTA